VGKPVYDVRLLSETGGSIRSSIGISVATEPLDDTNFDAPSVDGGVIEPSTPGLIQFVQQAWADTSGLPNPAPARSSWPKRVCAVPLCPGKHPCACARRDEMSEPHCVSRSFATSSAVIADGFAPKRAVT
jgi:hypothetical protein